MYLLFCCHWIYYLETLYKWNGCYMKHYTMLPVALWYVIMMVHVVKDCQYSVHIDASIAETESGTDS